MEIWQQEKIINWTQIILNSYEKLLAKNLIDRKTDELNQSKTLFFSPFVVFSHGIEIDPIYNYANEKGLNLWEMNWEELTKTPSRNTTQSMLREERENLLAVTKSQGYITNCQGIRVSKNGQKYQVNDISIWNLYTKDNQICGQAATFSNWILL